MSEKVSASPSAAQGGDPPALKAFEVWASEKFGVVLDERGRASAVKNGRRVAKISAAAIVNAARSAGAIPVGKAMSAADFDAAIEQARALPISIS